MARLMQRLCMTNRPLQWLLALVLALGFAASMAQVLGRSFDHFKTGFQLTGSHSSARCEQCHINGVFQGTPRTCSTCHIDGSPLAVGNIVKPVNHIPTQQQCDTCHTTATFTGVKYDHLGLRSGGCTDCHNGRISTGKPTTLTASGFDHSTTTASCDSCHSTRAWTPANSLDHSTFTTATNCVRCHNGTGALGKNASHIPTANNCISCHSPVVKNFRPATWNHTQMPVTNQCAVCHTGAYARADGPSTNHIPYKSLSGVAVTSCDTCHKGSFAVWNNGVFHNNVSIATQCATCHLTTVYGATAKATTPIHSTPEATGTACENCHYSTRDWTLAKPSHASFTSATNCSTCHNGTIAPTKNSTHIVTALNCESCHSPTGTTWKPTKWNHTQMPVVSQCSTCHSGAYPPADGPDTSAAHVAFTTRAGGSVNCDACHRGGYVSWNPGKFHTGVTVTNTCETCHGPSATLGLTIRPSSAIHTGVTGGCEACHNTSSWFGAKPDHSTFTGATNCSTCHNGTAATGKASTHFPTAVNCVTCHSATATGWKPASWNHTQDVVTNCATCHSGSYPPADGKTTNHIPYTAVAPSANCSTCHTGGYASWFPGRLHTNVAVTTTCESCHLTTAYGATGKPATAIHTGVVNGCESCHNTSAWLGAKPNHASFTISTNCLTCHNGSAATGKNATHIPVASTNCVTCHSATASTWRPANWNHTQVTVANQCATCHTGSYLPADGKTANHIPYTGLTGASNCDSCHKGGYASWNPGYFHANITVSTNCSSCHLTSAYGVTAKPSNSTHSLVTGNCESCHHSTSTWSSSKPDHAAFLSSQDCLGCHGPGGSTVGKSVNHINTSANCSTCHIATQATWRPSTWKHDQGVAVTGVCANCHNGVIGTGTTATHISREGLGCDSCHRTSPIGASIASLNWKIAVWDHSWVPTAATRCSTCHTGANPPADGKPANHIPYASIAAASAANCNACHSGYVAWNNGKFHLNFASVTTQCATCHLTAGFGATAKPATAVHATVTGNCESCHTSTSTWLGARPNHTLYNASTNCQTCHDGASATGKPTTHIPTTLNCITCHSATGTIWKPTTWNHTQMPVVNQCQTCHSGAYPPADGKTTTHIPYTGLTGVVISNCDTCHKGGYASWFPGKFHSYVSISTQCSTCHLSTAYGATGKPNTAIHSGVVNNCESCHTNTSSWLGAKPNHSTYTAATVCTTCHNGTTATGKNASHFPTTVNCVSCHTATLTVWKPSTWNHTQMPVANQCATCHTGAYPPADPKTANHIPYATLTGVAITNCDTCHKGGYATWNPGKFHLNVSITTQCATCHLTTAYGNTGKPATATHATVTGNCESCHISTASWLTYRYTHAVANAVGTGTCDTCHYTGGPGKGKTATHIPVPAVAKCDACHKSQVSFASPTMSHTAVTTATCKSCHNGNYTSEGVSAQGALGKPSLHIPEATKILNGATLDCNACHIGTTVWTNEKMNHNSSMGSGSGWCIGCHATGTSYLGNMTRFSLTHRGGNSVKTDCSQSGCHRPLGNTGSTYSKWN